MTITSNTSMGLPAGDVPVLRPEALPAYERDRGLALLKAYGKRGCVFELAEKMAAGATEEEFDALKSMPITTRRLSAGVLLLEHTGACGNMLVSYGPDGALLTDLYYPDIAHRALAALREVTQAPLRYAIPTHFHIDHAGGAALFAEQGAVVVGQKTTRTRMALPHIAAHMGVYWDAFPQEAWPTLTFEGELTLFFNEEEIVVHQMPGGHTDTDLLVHFVRANVIHVGDTFVNFPTYPFLEVNAGADSVGLLESIEHVIGQGDADTVIVPGHGPLATMADLMRYRDLLKVANDQVAERMAMGNSRAEVVAATAEILADFAIPDAFIEDWIFVGDVFDSLAGRRPPH